MTRRYMGCKVDEDGTGAHVYLNGGRSLRLYVDDKTGECVVNLDHGRLIVRPQASNEIRLSATES